MNYFIFKGINSNSIKGLIVQELPQIVKAKKRFTKTEIEGLDGDILEELGYEAYDKIIKIGITKECDIDELINWLDGSGQLILSNEPTKYYNVEIVDSINFERLLRYKTATIKLHTQPFKYLINEENLVEEIEEQTTINIENKGYIDSKPIMTIYGTGNIQINLNNNKVFLVDMKDDEYITIDTIKEDAYKGVILKNRQMIGDFNNIKLQPGQNTITWTGNLTKIEIEPKSRWL